MTHINSTINFQVLDREKVLKTMQVINDKKASQQNDILITAPWEFFHLSGYDPLDFTSLENF